MINQNTMSYGEQNSEIAILVMVLASKIHSCKPHNKI